METLGIRRIIPDCSKAKAKRDAVMRINSAGGDSLDELSSKNRVHLGPFERVGLPSP